MTPGRRRVSSHGAGHQPHPTASRAKPEIPLGINEECAPIPRARGSPRELSRNTRHAFDTGSADDSVERIMATADEPGAKVGAITIEGIQRLQPCLRDPWGNEIVLWGKAGKDP
jgi:hypothetical protein